MLKNKHCWWEAGRWICSSLPFHLILFLEHNYIKHLQPRCGCLFCCWCKSRAPSSCSTFQHFQGQRCVYSANDACGASRSRAYHQTENPCLGLPDFVHGFLCGGETPPEAVFDEWCMVSTTFRISSRFQEVCPVEGCLCRKLETITKALDIFRRFVQIVEGAARVGNMIQNH